MANEKLKNEIKYYGLTQWKIADALGVSEVTLNRWLRHELTPEKKAAVSNAIKVCRERNDTNG